MTSCRDLDNNRSALSAASAFAIATAGANEGTPNKEKYRRMSLASTGVCASLLMGTPLLHVPEAGVTATGMEATLPQVFGVHCGCSVVDPSTVAPGELPAPASYSR